MSRSDIEMIKERLYKLAEYEPRIEEFIKKTDFFNFEAPASIKYHSNYEGGYVNHTCFVVVATICHNLHRVDDLPRQVFLALVHDLGKSEKYHKVVEKTLVGEKWVETGFHWEYSYDYNDIFKTFEILARLGIELTEEERSAIIYHHGGFTGRGIGNPHGYVDMAIHLHSADMIATHIYEKKVNGEHAEKILKGLEELDNGETIEHEEIRKLIG